MGCPVIYALKKHFKKLLQNGKYLPLFAVFQIKVKTSRAIMLFQRALWRELVINYVSVLMVLLTITTTTLFIRLLGDAAHGELEVNAVLIFLSFGVFSFLPLILSLTLFIAIIMAFSRAYRESEMVVWTTAGLGLTAWVRPVLMFAMPVVLLIGALNFAVIPWALSKKDDFRKYMDRRDELSVISPGMFTESKQTNGVFFVESLAENGTQAKHVFIQSMNKQVLGITVAQTAVHRQLPDGERFLVLQHGRRYEGVPGQADYKISEFDEYWMQLLPQTLTIHRDYGANAQPTLALMRHPTSVNQAEFVWRSGFPLSALVLSLFAIPLSFVNPRAGRSFTLILALLIFVIYNNLLNIDEAWVAQGRIGFVLGLLGLHGVMILIMLGMFWQRMTMSRWRARP
jgi:lipopolysaccharide export system permease protein